MEIDVFTFVAQVFNFGVLVYLLRRFLYGPIQKAMHDREQSIAAQVEAAATEKAAAEVAAEAYRAELEELRKAREAMLAEAQTDADRLATQLGSALKARMTAREEEWRASVDRRVGLELKEFRAGVRQEIVETLRSLLTDLADDELERRIRTTFLLHIDELGDEEVGVLMSGGEHPLLTVVTAFALQVEDREEIEERLRRRFGDEAKLMFDVDTSRIAGIELRCHGHRLGWSLDDSLETLDEAVKTKIDHLTKDRADASASPA